MVVSFAEPVCWLGPRSRAQPTVEGKPMQTKHEGTRLRGVSLLGTMWAVLLLIEPTRAPAQAVGQMAPEELYQGYKRWLHSMHTSLAFRETEEKTISGYDWSHDKLIATRLICRDGRRSAAFMDAESFMKDQPRKNNVRARLLCTEERRMAYSGRLGQRPRAMVIDERPGARETGERLRSNTGYSVMLEGYIHGDNRLWITDIAEQAHDMTVRKETETIDGHRTFVLEIDGDYGKHTIWLDPACGYCPRQLVVVKEPGDLWDTTTVGEDMLPMRTYPRSVLQRHELRIDSVTLQMVGDTYVPVSGTVSDQLEFADGRKAIVRAVFQREMITTSPDFEAVRTEFLQGIPDGVPVFFQDELRKGIRYQWHQGEPRPAVSTMELKALEKIIDEIDVTEDSTDAQHSGGRDTKISTENTLPVVVAAVSPDQESSLARRSRRWWFLGTCTGLFVGGVGLCVLGRRRRKERT